MEFFAFAAFLMNNLSKIEMRSSSFVVLKFCGILPRCFCKIEMRGLPFVMLKFCGFCGGSLLQGRDEGALFCRALVLWHFCRVAFVR